MGSVPVNASAAPTTLIWRASASGGGTAAEELFSYGTRSTRAYRHTKAMPGPPLDTAGVWSDDMKTDVGTANAKGGAADGQWHMLARGHYGQSTLYLYCDGELWY